MAVDTRNKRASAMCVGTGVVVFPDPDGGLGTQGDRQHIGLVYRAIEAAEQVISGSLGMVRKVASKAAKAIVRELTE